MKSAGHINSVYCCQFALLHAFFKINVFVCCAAVQHHCNDIYPRGRVELSALQYLAARGSHVGNI